jgi:hypothetical protein
VIEVRNLVVKKHVPFKEYLVTPGHSFSSIAHMNRVKPFEITKKIKFGSQVDSYLFTPKEFKLGYAIADGCKSAFILAQHPHIDKCEIHKVEISHGFWERACLMYGEPI